MAKKKFETALQRAIRFQEELRMNCTTEKGIVRPLTEEEKEYRIGFNTTLVKAGVIPIGEENAVMDPLYESKLEGVSSAFAYIRGERKHQLRVEEQKQQKRLNRKYPTYKKSKKNKKRRSRR
ncbi:MAG: hypothetical protein NC310_01985 [Roseburia sp.]|nr:hypothetical protein [Roseburia sp.]MCM1556295.1 hypothetical protein [Anaeroplasma bactoclasticum]